MKSSGLKLASENLYNLGTLSKEELQKSIKNNARMFPKGIPECGADALRFTLCSHNIKSHFINFDIDECYTNKLFFNKIWQATRYTISCCEKDNFNINDFNYLSYSDKFSKMDLWILSRLAYTEDMVATSIDSYNFHLATFSLKSFFYNNFCDIYLETTKNKDCPKTRFLKFNILTVCLSRGIHLMEVFTPFLSQHLGSFLPKISTDLKLTRDIALENEVNQILEICAAVRQQKSLNNITKKHDPVLRFETTSIQAQELLKQYKEDIQLLTFSFDVVIDTAYDGEPIAKSTASAICSFEIFAKINNFENFNIHSSNMKKLTKLEGELQKLLKRTENKGYKEKAPEKTQRKHKERVIFDFF